MIHSSSACVGILMSFMDQGVVGLTEAMSVVLGSNIGTCITAVMASFKGGAAARQTAYAHVLFNVIGVAAVYPLLSSITGFISGLSESPAQQIAHFSLLFNVVTSLLFFAALKSVSFADHVSHSKQKPGPINAWFLFD